VPVKVGAEDCAQTVVFVKRHDNSFIARFGKALTEGVGIVKGGNNGGREGLRAT
jgi:hypothetical protein